MKLLIASKNLHKVREFKALLRPLGFDLYSLADFPAYIPPPETGSTFQENASLKALDASLHTGLLSFADDSGLVVPALNSAPGVFSSRYAGENATDKENRIKLIKEMQRLQGLERSAYFECSICLALGKKVIKCVKGTVEGSIALEEKGRNGFGYDALFLKHDYGKTFAELDEGVKNQISHRGKAFEKLLIALETYSSNLL